MYMEEILEAAKSLGLKLERVKTKKIILRHFRNNHNNGLYLVTTYDHIFCLDNGIIYDPCTFGGLRRLITGAWKVLR